MTNELEKQFFDTFGIEPKNISTGECKYKITPEFCEQDCLDCKNTIKEKTYPQITDRILLELICILNTRPVYASNAHGTNVYDLKNYVLKRCIYEVDNINHQVRTLFEES